MRSVTLAAMALLMVSMTAALGDAPSLGLPDFTLQDTAGKPWKLSDAQTKKAIALIFLGTECPISNAYATRLGELQKAYEKRGITFAIINANSHETPARVAAHAKEHGINGTVLMDPAGRVADLCGAKRTPEAFLLDAGRRIVYRGRIDDQFGIGFQRVQPTRKDLAIAIDEVLAGKPVSIAKTDAPGCLIDRPLTPKADGPVTFTKQVSRILQKNCQECHRPGQVGPMPLVTYDDAVAWSEMMREVVSEGRMPPWHADPKYGHFSNDRRLAEAEKKDLLAWIEGGCPKGDDKLAPPAKEFPEGWRIGKPDVVVDMPQTYHVPAKAGPGGIEYQYFVVHTDFPEDRWVQAAEAKPGNRALVHHIIVFVRPPDGGHRDRQDKVGNGFLVAYAPGDMPVNYGPGIAKKIPKGSDLIFQMHYTPNGVAGDDRSSVAMIFAKAPPQLEARTRAIEQNFLAIPKGASHHEVKVTSTFRKDVELLSLMPHMHLRGKDFEYRVLWPNGKTEVLLSVPRYDFNWQSVYRLKEPLRLPAGTAIECIAHYDNSAANPNNPDPTKNVFWGDQTWEEMMIGFVDYVYSK